MFGARSCWCFHFIIHFKQLKFNQKKCKISLDGWQQSLMHCMLRILVWKACRRVYVSVCLCTVCPCPTYLSPLIFFPQSSRVPSRMWHSFFCLLSHQSISALVTASEIPRCSSEEGRGGRRGEEKRGEERREGSDRAIVARILQGLPEQPTLKTLCLHSCKLSWRESSLADYQEFVRQLMYSLRCFIQCNIQYLCWQKWWLQKCENTPSWLFIKPKSQITEYNLLSSEKDLSHNSFLQSLKKLECHQIETAYMQNEISSWNSQHLLLMLFHTFHHH